MISKSDTPVLELSEVTIGTDNVLIDRNISLRVGKGEILGVIGESGSGKSSLLRSLLFLDYDPVKIRKGSVLYNGKELTGPGGSGGMKLSVIFQSLSMAFDPITRIRDQYLETMQCSDPSATKKQMTEKACELLAGVSFDEPEKILNAYPFELSGGMVQRAAIVQAMLNDPELLLADEMTSALDLVSQEQVIDALLKIRKTYGTAILFVTHNMAVIRKLADKVAVMYGGRIVEYGRKEEILFHSAHPYTQALIKAVPKTGGEIPQGIPGQPPEPASLSDSCPFFGRCPNRREDCAERFPEKSVLSKVHYIYCIHPE